MNEFVYSEIEGLAHRYAEELRKQVALRMEEMEGDNNDYYLIYRVLGILPEEGKRIDAYQNKGRFVVSIQHPPIAVEMSKQLW